VFGLIWGVIQIIEINKIQLDKSEGLCNDNLEEKTEETDWMPWTDDKVLELMIETN